MASRSTKYLTENRYINTSVQKGGVPEFVDAKKCNDDMGSYPKG